jgi:hypothetical protein
MPEHLATVLDEYDSPDADIMLSRGLVRMYFEIDDRAV